MVETRPKDKASESLMETAIKFSDTKIIVNNLFAPYELQSTSFNVSL